MRKIVQMVLTAFAVCMFVFPASAGDSSILEISGGKLTDTSANVIPAAWTNSEVTV